MTIALTGVGAEASAHPGTTFEVTPPAVNDGEFMLLIAVYSDDASTPRVNESGWTPLGDSAGTADSDRRIAIWGKFASSESGTYTVDTVEGTSLNMRGFISVWTGVHASMVDQTEADGPDTTNSATYDPAAIVTQTANAIVITAICAVGGANQTHTEPSGYTRLFSHTHTSAPYMEAAYLLVASPASTDPGTWNVVSIARDTSGITMALKAATSAGAAGRMLLTGIG